MSAPNSDKTDYSSMKVVLIDDDPMVLRSVEAVLSDMGLSVTAFNQPAKGLAWIRENRADIVISDILMPGCDGFEVLGQVKQIDPQCDVIFITAHAQLDIAIRAIREGAADFVEKPFSAADLHAAIARTSRFQLLSRQKALLSDRVDILSDELLLRNNSHNVMLGQSAIMKKIAADIVDLASTMTTVLIVGESGTGKELVARGIHLSGPRKDKPFLTLNCPSIPEDLFESEVFGHRRGAFTGAVETTGGYVEASRGGTLFLDEIADLPLSSQGKMLRLLEQRTFLPVGDQREKEADIRIMAATNQSLEQLVKEKRFREDLYYRLSVCTLKIPPLRERKEDIPLLALYFSLQSASEMGKSVDGIEPEALRMLTAYDYPGNVRELRNIIESSVIRCRHAGTLRASCLPPLAIKLTEGIPPATWAPETLNFEAVERRLYQEALSRTINNVSAAARLLGLSRGKLRRRLAALDVRTVES
jgi:DNA-binding NtrC family response regulator